MFERYAMTKTKTYIAIVGLVLGGMLFLALMLIGGAAAVKFAMKERPKFSTGVIITRDYDKPWTEYTTQQQYVGQTCTKIGQTQTCTNNYITIPVVINHPANWDIRIKNCNVQKKDGTYWLDKQGRRKCFTKWVSVDETTYNRVAVGQKWRG